uniref:Uncharacterized protein n=1 Tax=Rhizophora mucronata TaxID=61149 RepID=A0A2P2NY86_RHIMU
MSWSACTQNPIAGSTRIGNQMLLPRRQLLKKHQLESRRRVGACRLNIVLN